MDFWNLGKRLKDDFLVTTILNISYLATKMSHIVILICSS